MNLVLCIGGDPQQFQNSFNQNSILFRNGKQTSQSFEAILGNSLTIGNEENYQEGVEFLREALPGEPGIDYPIYSLPTPQTSFDCSNKVGKRGNE